MSLTTIRQPPIGIRISDVELNCRLSKIGGLCIDLSGAINCAWEYHKETCLGFARKTKFHYDFK